MSSQNDTSEQNEQTDGDIDMIIIPNTIFQEKKYIYNRIHDIIIHNVIPKEFVKEPMDDYL